MPVINSSDFPYTIRNYQSADFGDFVRLNIEAEELEPTGRCISPEAIAERLGRPHYSPAQDLFLVEKGGGLVGYMDLVPELTIGRVILDGWVHPEHRRRGLATRLLGYAIPRIQELGAKVAHVNIAEDNLVAQRVLSKLGFERVRRFLELRLDLARLHCLGGDQEALPCCHLQPGEEEKLAQIQNRSFAGSWGYNLDTVEAITYRTSLSHCSPEDVVLTCDGDRIVGYCWAGVTGGGGAARDEKEGRIFMLGVDPDYRGRGIGRGVLRAGLDYLRSKGLRVAWLTVDSENKVACALYLSLGFELKSSRLWYEKVIGQDS